MAYTSTSLLLLFTVAASQAARSYRVAVIGIELRHTSEHFYSDETEFEMSKYNDTVDTINVVMDVIKDLPNDTMVNIQSYELRNNKWEPSIVHINQTWCHFIKSDQYFMEGIIQQSNYPKECPITINKFIVENFVIDEERLPEQIPGEYWQYTFQQYVKEECILDFVIEVEIKRLNGAPTLG